MYLDQSTVYAAMLDKQSPSLAVAQKSSCLIQPFQPLYQEVTGNKGNVVSIKDSTSGEEIPLFNPRRERWQDHFIWSADGRVIIGLTAVGKSTITALDLNRERVIDIRQADILLRRHPPPRDPIQKNVD